MSSVAAIKAGHAYVLLSLRDNLFTRGLHAASAKLKAFGAGVAALGKEMLIMDAAQLALFGLAARAWSKAGSDLLDMSDRVGISVEALSELGFAAGQSGASIEDLETGLGKMAKVLNGLDETAPAVQAALADLGVNLEELKAMSPEDQFTKLAEVISGIEHPGERAAMALQLLGKSGRKLIPMMRDLAALRAEGRDSGAMWTREDAEKADAFGDAMSKIWEQMKKVVFVIGGSVAPAISDVAEVIGKALKATIEWLKANGDLIEHIFITTAAFVAFDLAVFTIGKLLWGVGAAIGFVATALGIVTSAITFFLSPVGLAVAALGGLLALLVKASAIASQAFAGIGEAARTAFAGIGDAMKAGDFELAGQIAWTGLKVGFLNVVLILRQAWGEFVNFFATIWAKAIAGWQMLWNEVVAQVKKGAVELKSTLKANLAFIVDPFNAEGREGHMKDVNRERDKIEEDRLKEKRRLMRGVDEGEFDRREKLNDVLIEQGKEINAGVRELAKLREQAAAAVGEAKPVVPKERIPDVPDLVKKATVAIRGTFDTATIGRAFAFGTDKIDEQQLKVQEKIKAGVDKVAAAAAGGGLMFWKP